MSFDLQVDGAEVIVKNACIHTIAETLLGSFPNYRSTIPADARTTAQDIQSALDELSERGINEKSGRCLATAEDPGCSGLRGMAADPADDLEPAETEASEASVTLTYAKLCWNMPAVPQLGLYFRLH